MLGLFGGVSHLDPFQRALLPGVVVADHEDEDEHDHLDEAEQQQLVSAFSDFSVATYASRFAAYDGERFEVTGQKPSAGGVIVATKLTPKEGDPVTLDYLMKTDEAGNWRIVDVFLNGTISELATRRSEFGSIVQRDGVPALVNSLSDKAKQMGPS